MSDIKDTPIKEDNTLPGTIRTMKNDAASTQNNSPEDRLNKVSGLAAMQLESDDLNSPSQSVKISPTVKTTTPVSDTKSDVSGGNLQSKSTPITLSKSVSETAKINPSAPVSIKPKSIVTNIPMNEPKEMVKPVNVAPTKTETPATFPDMPSAAPVAPLKSGFDLGVNEDVSSNPSTNPIPATNPVPKKPTYTGFSEEEEGALENPMAFNTTANPAESVSSTSKKSTKTLLVGVGLFIVLIGAGIGGWYVWTTMSMNNSPEPTTVTTPTPSVPVDTGTPLINPSSVSVTVTSATIRSDILNALSTTNVPARSFVRIQLVDSAGQELSWSEIASSMGFSVPLNISQEIVKGWVYAYNQNGVYKIAGIIELNSDQSGSSLVQTWAQTVPQDMASFSLSSVSRNLPDSSKTISSVNTTIPTGEQVTSYFYNYSDSTDSIDMTTRSNYILLSTSQESMQYLKNAVDPQ